MILKALKLRDYFYHRMVVLLQQKRWLFACLVLCFAGLVVFAQPAMAQCAIGQQGGPAVFYQGCTETTGANGTTATLTQPTGAVNGDFLLAVISTDGSTTPAPGNLAGWTNLSTLNSQDVTQSVWYRTTIGGNLAFSWTGAEAFVATYMRFTNVEGFLSNFVTGTTDPVSPAVTTDRANSLVIRLSTKDWRTTDLTGGLTQITSTSAGSGNSAVDTAIGFVNQAAVGTTGTYAFLNSNNDGWQAGTIVLRPPLPAVAFRITHSGSGTTCTPTSVTFTAVNALGGTVTNYTGNLTITAPDGDWFSIGDQAGGTFNNGTAGDGDFTYSMVAGDNGNVTFNYLPDPTLAASLDINVTDGTRTENSNPAGLDQQLSVSLCGFTLSHDGSYGTCTPYESITLTAVEPNGVTVDTDFTGTVRIITTAGTDTGTWAAVSPEADGTLTPLGNGDIEYTFDPADNGSVVLRYTHPTAGDSVDFNLRDTRELTVDVDLGADPQLATTVCGYIISHDGYAGTCGYELITITDTDPGSVETISGTTTTTIGSWQLESGGGTFTPLPDGNFQYTYDPGDGGIAVFRYYHPTPAASVGLDVLVGGFSQVVGTSGPLVVEDCELLFETISDGQNCVITAVTLKAVVPSDPGLNPVTGYTGTVTLSTSSGIGNWAAGTAMGFLDNGASGDGDATYTFALADGGGVTFDFTHDDPDTLTVSANDTVNSFSDTSNAFTILACSFYVSLSSPGDTCTPNVITISVHDGNGAQITDYAGPVTIDTTFANGDWAIVDVANPGSFVNNGDGNAQYTFVAGDGGDIVLELRDPIVETTKIIVTDGLLVVDSGNNPDLVIQPCEFRITLEGGGTSDICTLEAVTFTLVNSVGMTATDYTGQIFISTSTGNGIWSDFDGTNMGTNSINNTGGGTANYTFHDDDDGSVTFYYQNIDIEIINFDVTDGSNSEIDMGAFDPDLDNGACFPQATEFQCVNPGVVTSASVDVLGSAATNGSRAVVLVTGYEAGSVDALPSTGVTINGNNATLVNSIVNTGNPANSRTITEMWMVLDADLPTSGGSVSAVVSHTGGEGIMARCLYALKNIDQVFAVAPYTNARQDNGGAISTTVEVPAAESLVISAVTDNNPGSFTTTSLGSRDYSFENASDWTFGASSGFIPTTATVTVTETKAGTGQGRWTHVVGAFGPPPATLAYFSIAHDGSTTSCTMQQVTITAYDINGNIKTDYTGTITISMDANHGTWSQFPVTGVLTENPLDDDGEATYQFAVADNGTKTLNLLVPHNQSFEISVVDGSVVDDGNHPLLTVSSCEPVITATQCYAGTSGSISIVGPETSAARAVIMSIARESAEPEGGLASDPDIAPASVLFDGQPMSFVGRAEVSNGATINTTEMYAIFDTDLPTAAGTYNGAFAEEAGGSFPNTPAMCLTAVYGVEQSVPVAPAVATNTVVVSVTPASLTTTVTTGDNNALVMSIVSDDRNGGTYTSDLDTALWNNQTPPAGAVFSGFSGLNSQAGPISDTVVPSANPTIISHILAAFSPVVAGPPTADDFVPVILYKTFSGPTNYRAYGSSYRLNDNGDNFLACQFEDPNTGTSINVDVPAGSTFKGAFLYWSGDGDEEISPLQIDANVTLVRGATETFSITADEMFLIKNIGTNSNLDYFTGFKDVSAIVTTNGTYTLQGLDSQNGSPWEDTSACAAGWALVVVYENALEDIQVINLFHGFQPFQNSAINLVPGNFRMRTLDVGNGLPHGQLSHITIEGDDSPPSLNTANERLGLESAPDSGTFNYLTNSFNPPTAQYNSTVTRPIYDSFLDWTPTAGVNMDGYEALSLTSYGVDVDTHFLRGDTIGSPLYEFGIASPSPEHIVTQYSAGQDLVLLVGEVISVTNAPIVDLEVTVSEGPSFIVDGTSTYTISLINNGDGAGPDGAMTGSATVTVTFPAGLTITGTVTASGWNCVANNSPPATPLGLAALACEYDMSTPLAEGMSLPSITVPIAIGNETFFPNLVNQAEINVRALYHGGNCAPNPLDDTLPGFGTSPDPDECGISPQFDNVMDLEGGALSMNDLEEKSVNNNNVDGITTTINGRQTDLQLTKVAGILQEASAATYTITVTNLGPQAATKLITVSDTLPVGLSFVGKLETGDDDAWSCGAVGQNVTCTTNTDLAPAATADFLLGVQLSAPAIENATVNNTACVSIATGNFDTIAANNCDTESANVQGEPVAAQNKFLISVNLDNTTLGSGTGTLTFNADDIILYDPVTDVATMYYDDSLFNSDLSADINALHVRRNGHIIVSPATATTSISGVSYEPGDLLVYDLLQDTATLLFDGSAHFDSPTTNIDAVFEQDDGQLVISTVDTAGMHGGTAWQRGDWVRFDPSQPTPTATVILDGDSPAVFNASVQLNGTYFKVGGTPDYTITIGQTTANIATGNTTITGDDIASLQPGIDSTLEFRGSVPNGVFSPLLPSRFIDGVHIYQNRYFGHFSISESVSGDTCTPTTVVIRKHTFEDAIDTSYTGSIHIDMDYGGAATWSKIDGDGTLQPTGTGNQYIYTFVPSDNGEVTLALTVTEDGVDVNVDVSNGLVTEVPAEDPVFSFNDVISPVTYGDDFSSGDYNGNSGTSNFESGWEETDSDGLGAGTGNVRIVGGEAFFDNTPNSETLENNLPALIREVDLSLYTPGTLTLTFDWRTVSINTGDSFVVEARGDGDVDGWVNVATFTGLAGTNAGSENYNLTSILAGATQSVSENTQIRFRVAANYNVSGNFIIDDVQLSTSTSDCGVGAVHHYEISHIGYGVMCEAYQITFSAHDVAHTPVAPPLNTLVNLTTSAGKGSWSPLPAFPAITDAVLGDGQATYTFGLNQNSFTANFNLTNPVTPTETIHFNIQQGAIAELGIPGDVTDPFFTFAESGFIFTNSGGSQTIGVQIAGKRSNLAPANGIFLRAVDTNLDTLECEALFGGQTVQIEMQIQCTNPSSCATVGAQINGTVVPENDLYIPGPGGTIDNEVSVSFPAASAVSDEIVLNYPDAGEIQIHAEYELPIANNIAGLTEMNTMRGSSEPFVVRPFGFRVDMSANTNPFADDGTADDSFGNPDAGGSAFVRAGEAFTVNLQAVAYVEGAGQDTVQAGHPDPDADLAANPLTPNFGNEISPADWPVATLTHTVTLPVPNNAGTLSGTLTFDAFSGGQDNNTDITFSEVGIIDLEAHLAHDYLDSGEFIRGYVSNVGRFIPDHYEITSFMHVNRIQLDGFCSPASTFTYMGEPLELTVNLQAENSAGFPTRNYYAGFERLTDLLGVLDFSAMDLDTMDVLTSRLDSSGMTTFDWNNVFGNGDTGEGSISGTLILDKDTMPDGPYDMFTVGLVPVDADGVSLLAADLNLDLPPLGSTDTITVMTTGMRYGRLTINSTGGSEISISTVSGEGLDIPITFDLEYYNSEVLNFLVNPLDDCTTLSSDNLSVINDSWTDGLSANPGGTGTPSPTLTINVGVQTGTITVLENGSTDSSSASGDVPFYISSPFAADDPNTATGSVLIELDLDAGVDIDADMMDDVTYDFLKFDWRNVGELYIENPDGMDPDNPRAIIDFGVFQGHNRVINWQEILLTPE